MITIAADVTNTSKKITSSPVKRDISPSAATVTEDIFDFLCDIEPDSIPEAEIDTLSQLIDDLEYLDTHQMNEGALKAKHSTSAAKTTARQWYKKNRGRVKKLAKRLKTNAAKKKAEIMAKSDRTPVKKRKKKQYNTAGHEATNLTLKRGAAAAVQKLFENTPYRVIKSFSLDGIDARLNEKIEHVCGSTWILSKRDGGRYKIEVENNNYITPYLKQEDDVTVEDFL